MKIRSRIGMIAVILLISISASACSQSAPIDKVGLKYGHGPIEGNHFEKVVSPGSGAQVLGPLDDIVWLPAGQREYIVSKNTGEGDRKGVDFIQVPAKGGVLFDFEVSLYFKLNTRTNDIPGYKGGTLRKFWEQMGNKYHADTNGGWDTLLDKRLRKVLETAMRQKVFNYTPDELYANAEGDASGTQDAILQIQKDIAGSMKDTIAESMGAEYFCGPSFDRHVKGCPDIEFVINSALPATPETIASYEKIRQSANKVLAAKNDALAVKERAKGQQDARDALNEALKDPNYIKYLRAQAEADCAKRDGCTMIVNGSEGNVNVNTGK